MCSSLCMPVVPTYGSTSGIFHAYLGDMQNGSDTLNHLSHMLSHMYNSFKYKNQKRVLFEYFQVYSHSYPTIKLVVSDPSMEKHLGAAGENIRWEYFNKKKKTEGKKVEHITWHFSMNCRYRLKLFSWQAFASVLAMLEKTNFCILACAVKKFFPHKYVHFTFWEAKKGNCSCSLLFNLPEISIWCLGRLKDLMPMPSSKERNDIPHMF